MKSVLIVDDNLTQRLRLEEILGKTGYECQKIENGAMALAMILTNRVDLVIAELDAPVVHGFELLTHMAKRGLLSTISFIGITNYHSKMQCKLVKRAGADTIVAKPIDCHDLLARVKEALKNQEGAEVASKENGKTSPN